MKRREWRFRSQLLAVCADILLPLLFLFVLYAATLPGFSDSTSPSARHAAALDYAGASALN
jgi:hypothetical protein